MLTLAYHEVTKSASPYSYSVTSSQLAEHLAFIARSPGKFDVTFDDGHISHYCEALPALELRRLRATFFVTAGWTGVRPEYMSWEHLLALQGHGHRIGAHGWTHTLLTHCTDAQLKDELRRSKQKLEDRLAVSVESISLPGGRWNRRVIEACSREGYREIHISNPYVGASHAGGATVSGRLMVRQTMDGAALAKFARRAQSPVSLHKIAYGAKEMARTILGDRTYHLLWTRAAGSRS